MTAPGSPVRRPIHCTAGSRSTLTRQLLLAGAVTALAGISPLLSAAQLAAAVAAAPPAASAKDPCGSAPRCYNAGAFIAEVVQVSASAMTAGARNQSVAINMRFRNTSDKPVILAYQSGSSAALDNFGNGFSYGRPGHDASVKGIGMVAGRSVDTQFALAPGQSRSATFNIIRFNARPPIGDAWNYNLVIEEIEILPGQVVRSARQNSLSFSSLRAGSFTAAASADGIAAEGTQTGDPIEVANKVIDLFNRAKNRK